MLANDLEKLAAAEMKLKAQNSAILELEKSQPFTVYATISISVHVLWTKHPFDRETALNMWAAEVLFDAAQHSGLVGASVDSLGQGLQAVEKEIASA